MLEGRRLRIAHVNIVCQRYRVPILLRLTRQPNLRLRIIVGTGVRGTKLLNPQNLDGLDVVKAWTRSYRFKTMQLDTALLFNPTFVWHHWRFAPDVILLAGGDPFNTFMVLAYAKLFRKPVVWWTLGEVVDQRHSRFGKPYQKVARWFERRCTAYLAYWSVGVDYLLRMGYESRRCFNLVNVVDTDNPWNAASR